MLIENSHESTKVKVANRPEQSRESSRAKSRIVQNDSRELTKKSRIVLGANLSSRELSRHPIKTPIVSTAINHNKKSKCEMIMNNRQ